MLIREQELRAAIRRILSEDDGGGGYGGGEYAGYGSDMGMWGGGGHGGMNTHFLTGPRLKKVFDAFTAPFQLLYAGAKEAFVHVEALAHIAFETVATSIIPFLQSEHDATIARRNEKIKQIDSKYAPVKKAVGDAFATTDFKFISFCMYPAAYITMPFLLKSPEVGYGIVKFVAGSTVDDLHKSAQNWWDKTQEYYYYRLMYPTSGYGYRETLQRPVGALLREADEPMSEEEARKKAKELTAKKLAKSVQKALKDPKVKEMQQEASEAMTGHLSELKSQVTKALAEASTVQGLDKMSKGKLSSEYKQAEAEFEKKKTGTVDKESEGKAKKSLEEMLVTTTRKTIKSLYIKGLTAEVSQMLSAGLPANHPAVAEYKKLIEEIKAL
jgi:hypothetical protein